MSLDEYEAILAEKRAAVNKPAAAKVAVDMADFKGMETYVRKATEEEVVGLELTGKKKESKNDKEKAKPKKEVRACVLVGVGACWASGWAGAAWGGGCSVISSAPQLACSHGSYWFKAPKPPNP